MIEIKKTPDDPPSQGLKNENADSPRERQLYYITIILGITVIIAGLNIRNVWDGIVTALCAIVTIALIYAEVGPFEED